MKLKPSRHIMIGGLPFEVISDQRAWKIGHAMSGSRAPSSVRRKREMPSGTGMGRSCFCFIVRSERRMLFALPIWESQLAVYVFWDQRVGVVFGMGA